METSSSLLSGSCLTCRIIAVLGFVTCFGCGFGCGFASGFGCGFASGFGCGFGTTSLLYEKILKKLSIFFLKGSCKKVCFQFAQMRNPWDCQWGFLQCAKKKRPKVKLWFKKKIENFFKIFSKKFSGEKLKVFSCWKSFYSLFRLRLCLWLW